MQSSALKNVSSEKRQCVQSAALADSRSSDLHIDQEAPYEIAGCRPPAYWPSSTGRDFIRVEDLDLKYAPDLPSVVHNITFTIQAGEKVGIVGRTGSGKSTLALAFLRAMEPTSGRIVIDGLDIHAMGVQDLRQAIAYIPQVRASSPRRLMARAHPAVDILQDATLFSGTLRENLDPFKQHTDEVLNDMLRRVHLVSDGSASTAPPTRVPSSTALVDLSDSATLVVPPSISEATGPPMGLSGISHTSFLTLPMPASSAASIQTQTTERKATITLDSPVSGGGTNFSQGQRRTLKHRSW